MKSRLLVTTVVSLLAMASSAVAQNRQAPGLLSSLGLHPAGNVQRNGYSTTQASWRTLNSVHHGCAEPSCAAPVVCGCEPTCAAPPVCGCDVGCDSPCSACGSCCPLKPLLSDIDKLMNRIFACRCRVCACNDSSDCTSCGCEAPVVCGCEAPPVCGCEAPVVCGCDAPPKCGCAAPNVRDVLPGKSQPKSLPDPFLDDVPPAPPIPSASRTPAYAERFATTRHISDEYFAAQIRAAALKRHAAEPAPSASFAISDTFTAPAAATIPVAPRPITISAAEPIIAPRFIEVQTNDPLVKPVSNEMPIQRHVPVNPLR